MNDDNYPALTSSQLADAPWNQGELDERKFNVTISQTLSKSTKVTTNDYSLEGGYLDAEDGGGYVEDVVTNDTDWEKAYNNEHLTPLELIAKFKQMLKDTLESTEGTKLIAPTNNKSLKYLIEECSNWVDDETEVIED